ncbi:MAG: ribosomal RNA small subunit methyltransferase A [Syntrophomonadaceae bacterium]|nr:ribosomal RNA small subunit methyltransferase A [Syntrophomonadaceae bacterium]
MNLASKTEIKKILHRYEKHPQKKWGQNFLVDSNILHKIIEFAELSPEDYVIEIGPGIGVLTQEIAARSRGVLAIEIDSGMQQVLVETLAEYNNCHLVISDVLKVDLEQELSRSFALEKPTLYKVCANIPYNITTPIIFQLLEKGSHLEYALLMVQKELAQRIKAKPGSKDYGLLTLMLQYYARVEYMMDISRTCFYPAPEVDSALIKIQPHSSTRQLKNEAGFKSLVRRAFQMRRKTILNICWAEFRADKDFIRSYLEKLGLDSNSRPESLTLEEFICISENWPESREI